MKKYIYLALGAGVLALLVGAQNYSPCVSCKTGKGEGKTVRWQVPIRAIQADGEVLKVELNGIGPAASWQVGARVKPSAAGVVRIQTAEVQTEARSELGRPAMMSDIRAYEEGRVSITPGRVQISLRPGAPGTSTVIYVELPRSLILEVSSDHQLIAQGRVADAIHIQDGQLTSEKVTGLASLLMKAVVGRGAPQAGVQRLGRDEYYAPPADLVKSLVQFTRPTKYPSSGLPEGVSVSFLVSIGADGEIREIVGSRGDDRLVAHCRQAVLGWRFRPLLFNGGPVAVKGSILMTVDSQGDIVIPMLDGQ